MKTFVLAIVFWWPFLIEAQTPLWVQDSYREHNYSINEWYSGFVRDRLKADEELGKALKALERDAQNQLAESIIVTIEGNSKVENTSLSLQQGKNIDETTGSEYRQTVKSATAATAVKAEVKSFYDASTGMIYAFAAVRHADLAAFYQQQIDLDLTKTETVLNIAGQLTAAGKKISAFRKCEEAKQILDGVAYLQNLLAAVNPSAGEDALQTGRNADLQHRAGQELIKLEQSTFVYLNCKFEFKSYKDDAFEDDPGIICDIIRQALSENNCSVVDEPDEADYELMLIASTSQRSDGTGAYGIISYYANVRGSLYNYLTKKKTVDFSILNDPDVYSAGRSAEIAATKAFKLPALKDKILGKVLPKIKD